MSVATQAARRRVDPSRAWPWRDRAGFYLAVAAGLTLCLLTISIVLFMFGKGVSYLNIDLFTQSPTADPMQSKAGGFLDPLIGTFIVTTIGIAVAAPLGIAVAVWLSEYARPASLARAVESGVEMIAGVPSIVLAIFGLLVFTQNVFAFLSFRDAGGAIFGRSFLAAGVMMSLIALPLVVTSTRESLAQIPGHVREASYALGKTKWATIRRVLLPGVRPGIASGLALGTGRIIGDTAIIVVLLGASLQITGAPSGSLATLRGTGSTLTSYVYNNSPAGEGNAPEKAYAAAFVLLMVVIGLNALVTRLSRGSGGAGWTR